MVVRRQYLRELLSSIEPVAEAEGDGLEALNGILNFCRKRVAERAPDWAENIYRICHAIAKQYGLYPEMRQMMKGRWGVESMSQMTLSELQSLYYFMRGLERIVKR